MVYILIAISLFILLAVGLAALFLAGNSHRSSSMEDLKKDDE